MDMFWLIGGLVYFMVGAVGIMVWTMLEGNDWFDADTLLLYIALVLSAVIWFVLISFGILLGISYVVAKGIVWLMCRFDKSE